MRRIVMSMSVDMDSCMTGAILIGTGDQVPDIDLAHSQALPEQLENPDIPCIECGGSGDVDRNNWDHHYYDGDTAEKEYLPPACIQAAKRVLGEVPPIIQAIGAWDEGKEDPGFEHQEIREIFSGMLLDVRNVMEQAKEGIVLCQKWLAGDFSVSPKEEKWRGVKKEYDIKIAEAMDAVEFLDTLSGRVIAYVESPFWGTLRAIQNTIDEEDIVVVRNPANGKVTIALNPQGPGDLKFICELLNKLDPGWGGPITGKIIGSPQAGTKLEFNDIIDIVRLFM